MDWNRSLLCCAEHLAVVTDTSLSVDKILAMHRCAKVKKGDQGSASLPETWASAWLLPPLNVQLS